MEVPFRRSVCGIINVISNPDQKGTVTLLCAHRGRTNTEAVFALEGLD